MTINYDSVYKNLLNFGIVLLAVSITFSITLMNIAFVALFLALVIQLVRKKIRLYSTGLELPLALFIGFYILSAVLGPHPMKSIKDVSDNYWYILHMYLVVYLFGTKEIDKFIKILGWSAIAISIYTILQSLIGLTFNLEFRMGETIKAVAPDLERVMKVWGWPIYMGTGITGHHLTFGGQLMMLTFFTIFVFERKWPVLLLFMAFFLSFAYSAWVGFTISAIVYFIFIRKRIFVTAGIILLFLVLMFSVPGNSRRIFGKLNDRVNIWKTSLKMYSLKPVFGVGAGQYSRIFKEKYEKKFTGISTGARTHAHSIYLDILTEGGVLTFLAFMFFLWKFISIYAPPSAGKWKRLHLGCVFALLAVMCAGFFQTYLTDAENSVLIWTLAGLIVLTKKIESENKKFNIIYNP
ncbi:MAG: O-antigen ligase family protein [Elusimicrobia bacterium]|nr:O-antigen ligase family protein [Elusimicrobiota bacterium]